MQLTYSARGDRRMALGAAGGAVGLFLLATFLGVFVGGPLLLYAAVFGWFFSAVLLILAIIVFVGSLSSMRISIDETGVDVHGQGMDITLPWAQVEAINVETMASAPPRPELDATVPPPKYALVLWTVPDVPMPHPPTFPAGGTGPKGHVLVELEYLVESPDKVRQILREYAGHRFRSMATA